MTQQPSKDSEVYKVLQTPEAEHLAELYLLQGDLNAAHATLDLYFTKYAVSNVPKEGRATIISPSLFRDGVLLFCSCFSKRDKAKLNPEAVYADLGDDRMEYHSKLLALRDAFVAHNFGPQRQHHVVIIGRTIDGNLVPWGLTQYFIRFTGWIADEREQLLSFIDVARDHLKLLIDAAEIPVMEQVMAISSAELALMPDAEVAIPDAGDYRLSRSKFKKSGRGSRTPVPQRRLGRTTVAGS